MLHRSSVAWVRASVLVLAAACAWPAAASLVPRFVNNGVPEAYFDTVMGVTWLADANFSRTSHAPGALPDGRFSTWFDAMTWAQGLSIHGQTGWRLPSSDPSCVGLFNWGDCDRSKSEFHWMFLEDLGASYGYDITTSHGAGYDLFTNIMGGWAYWSETEDLTPGWAFVWSTLRSIPGVAPKVPLFPVGAPYFAWAVHDGDVGRASTGLLAEPGTSALSLALLVALALSMRTQRGNRP